jgi:hypothetical protein
MTAEAKKSAAVEKKAHSCERGGYEKKETRRR